MRLTQPLVAKLDDPDAEAVRQNTDQRIGELQKGPAAALIVVGDFVVPNAGSVIVPHSLGRRPTMVLTSPPRVEFGTPGLVTGGILIDLTGADIDRAKFVRLFASGYGVPVTVTVSVL